MQEEQITGWGDVRLNSSLPLDALVDFLNVLNQRLCAIENITMVDVNGEQITLTEFYKREEEARAKVIAEAAAKEKTGE